MTWMIWEVLLFQEAPNVCVYIYIYILNGTCSGGYLRPAIVEQDVVLPGFSRCSSWRFPKMGVPLFIIHFNRIVLCKPSILGYIPPFQETSISLWTLQSRRMFYAEWTRMDKNGHGLVYILSMFVLGDWLPPTGARLGLSIMGIHESESWAALGTSGWKPLHVSL